MSQKTVRLTTSDGREFSFRVNGTMIQRRRGRETWHDTNMRVEHIEAIYALIQKNGKAPLSDREARE